MEKRRQRKYEKEKNKVRRKLSLHLFSVSAAEQNAPTHKKLKKNASQDEINKYLDYRMKLRRIWIDKFFEFHTGIDPMIREELKKEAYEDIQVFADSLLAKID